MATEDGPRRGWQHTLNGARRHRGVSHMTVLLLGILIGFYSAVLLSSHGSMATVSAASDNPATLARVRDLDTAPTAAGEACPPCKCKACPQPASDSSSGPAAGLSPAKLQKDMGLTTYGFVDGKQAFSELLPFLPQTMENDVYDQAMVLMTKGSKFEAKKATEIGGVFDFEDLHTCNAVQVLFMGYGQCYVAINSPVPFSSSHVARYKTDESSPNRWSMVPRIAKEGSTPPIPLNRAKHEKFLLELLTHLPDLEKQANTFFEKVADEKKRVMVMALNEGDIDMLVNFVCSAKQANIPLDNLVVIGADQSVVDVATSLNLNSFSHPAFGHLPSEHAVHYGDAGFLAIMWLKIVSVWIAVRLGYDVLFQDADLVWFRDPWGVFNDPEVDAYFMDDGARSERFSPLYANSGFYFLRSNPRVIHFMQTVLFSYDMIVQYASHQTIVIQTLQEHITRNAMRVKILLNTDFAGGQVFHHRKELMQQISARTYLPYTFHMCWTQTKADKLQNFWASDLWYLTAACNGTEATMKARTDGTLSMATCCLDPMANKGAASSSSSSQRRLR